MHCARVSMAKRERRSNAQYENEVSLNNALMRGDEEYGEFSYTND